MSPLRVGKLIVRGGESVGKYEHWGGKMSKIFIQFIYLVKRVEYLNNLSNGEGVISMKVLGKFFSC